MGVTFGESKGKRKREFKVSKGACKGQGWGSIRNRAGGRPLYTQTEGDTPHLC